MSLGRVARAQPVVCCGVAVLGQSEAAAVLPIRALSNFIAHVWEVDWAPKSTATRVATAISSSDSR